jgi:hypothetical protein
VAFLQDRAGTQFDPHLVAAFVRELPAILAIKHRFEDRQVSEQKQAGASPRPPLINAG